MLVTIFGSAHGSVTAPTVGGLSVAEQARRAFVEGADAAFLGGAVLLAVAIAIVAVLVRRRQPTLTTPAEMELETAPRA